MGTRVSLGVTPPDLVDATHAGLVVPCPAAAPRQKLLDRVRHAIRIRHYSRRTEQAYESIGTRSSCGRARARRIGRRCCRRQRGTVQDLLGHRDVRTTMTYLHVMNRGALGVKSPMDRL